ncbi:MAG: PhzF family phenazine biosynthesis protein [Gemmatimonadota bacterium]
MKIPLYQIDAFADRPFTGNPAAVCPLLRWLPDHRLQAIASENQLSETAFLVEEEGEEGLSYGLRWFTPVAEVDLCGHATLASAWLVLTRLHPEGSEVALRTRSGVLTVRREDGEDDRLAMSLPARPAEPCEAPSALLEGLGITPREILAARRDYLVVVEAEADVECLAPAFDRLRELDRPGVIVTAPGRKFDFVSRFFAPALGVPEDPVTGSAHCTLTPYWSIRLGKRRLRARQISPRGGDVCCEDHGDRILISGKCAPYLEGTIDV